MGEFEYELSDSQKAELDIDIELADIFDELMSEEALNTELAMHYARRAYIRGALAMTAIFEAALETKEGNIGK